MKSQGIAFKPGFNIAVTCRKAAAGVAATIAPIVPQPFQVAGKPLIPVAPAAATIIVTVP